MCKLRMFVALEKIVQAVVCLDLDDQEHTTDTWLLTLLRHPLQASHDNHVSKEQFCGTKCLRMSFAAAGEMIETAEVSRMAAHSATVA